MIELARWKEISNGLFCRNEETPRLLRWIYDLVDEDMEDEEPEVQNP